MEKLRKLLGLKGTDRHVLLRTFLLLGSIRVGLWLLSFQTLQKLLARVSQPSISNARPERISIGKIIWAVNLSSRYMPGQVKCLARALTTQVLMRQSGYTCELRIGVAKGGSGKLEAHAWIEHQGIVVIGYLKDLSRYTPMPSLDRG
jgi:Transglutaminase-like superfamily